MTLIGFDEDEETVKGLQEIARAVDAKIKDRGKKPAFVSLLPEKDLIGQGKKYFKGNLGLYNSYPFFTKDVFRLWEGIKGDYRAGYSLFIISHKDSEENQKIFNDVRKSFKESPRYKGFKSVDERLIVPQIARYGLRSTWVQEYKGSFQDLLNICKQHIFGSSSLVERANDIGAVFDYYLEGGQKLTMTVGPMEADQLKRQFLSFEPESLPSSFLYVDVDLGDTATKQFSIQHLRNFFDKAVKEGEKLGNEMIAQIGVSQ